MKKILSTVLILALLFALSACGVEEAIQAVETVTEVVEIINDITTESGSTPSAESTPGSPDDNADAQEPIPDPTSEPSPEPTPEEEPTETPPIAEDGWYYSKEDVSLYLYTYGYLPENFITKQEARSLGWSGGSVEDYAPGYAIGGDVFGNYEGLLPKKSGRTYYECDIDTDGYSSRGSRRIVFSNDGLIYYTHNHYESFTLLYGEE